jgi:serine protease Do
MKGIHFRPTLLTLVLALVLGSAAHANQAVFNKAIYSTGFVTLPLQDNKLSYGTVWVVNAKLKLVVTNYHVVTDRTQATVYFPAWDNGRLITQSGKSIQMQPGINGKVIARESKYDLALIQLESLPANVRNLPLGPSARRGDKVYSIGNSGMNNKPLREGSLWKYRIGDVRSTTHDTVTLNESGIKINAFQIITSSGTQPGDSGGPLVDAEGRLVAVASSANNQGTYAIDVRDVRAYLGRIRI